MRKTLFFILIIVFSAVGMSGCKKHYVQFYVQNVSNDTLLIQYHPVSSADTLLVELYPSSSLYPTYKFIHEEGDPATTDWWSYWNLHIQYIKNTSGDTINFDPNSPSNWHFGESETYHNYQLLIDDTSF